ncbi:MAG: hypothetical protein IT559_06210 [Alphaproteobacteria bacterium]|nr:hypothetical protein [Alphaproteobacteria bacterium]
MATTVVNVTAETGAEDIKNAMEKTFGNKPGTMNDSTTFDRTVQQQAFLKLLTDKQQGWAKEIDNAPDEATKMEAADKLSRSLTDEQKLAAAQFFKNQFPEQGNAQVASTPEVENAPENVAKAPTTPGVKPALPETFNAAATQVTDPASRPAITLSGNQVAAQNADVLKAQTTLAEMGINVGPLDGKEGPLTRAAIEKYAEIHKLDPREMTLASLNEHMEETKLASVQDIASKVIADIKNDVAQTSDKIDNIAKGTVFTYANPMTGEGKSAGTQTMRFDESLDRMVIEDAAGRTPFERFMAAVTGPAAAPAPQPEVQPDADLSSKMDRIVPAAMSLG